MANPLSDYAGDIGGSFRAILGIAMSWVVKLIAGILGIGLITFLIFWWKRRKAYNIPVTIWIPRSNGKIIDELQAKAGFFKSRQPDGGQITVLRLKRKGLGSLDLPPPSSHFLVGLSRKLYLIQKGVDDFEPVLPDSFRYVTTQKGKKIPVINLKCINQDATAWTEDNRENAKRRFTLHGFWEKYKDFIQITIFIFIVMLSIYINWIGMKDVVAGLEKVANTFAGIQGGGVSVK